MSAYKMTMYKNSEGNWRFFNEDTPYSLWTFDMFMDSGAFWGSIPFYGGVLFVSLLLLWHTFSPGALIQHTLDRAGDNNSVLVARGKSAIILLVVNMFLVTDRSMVIGEFLYSYVRPLYWYGDISNQYISWLLIFRM